VGRVGVFGPDSNRISAWSGGAERRCVISSENKRVAGCKRQVLALSSSLVYVVSKTNENLHHKSTRGKRVHPTVAWICDSLKVECIVKS
jgi:hypothetical protein